jgi:hypothetical protein
MLTHYSWVALSLWQDRSCEVHAGTQGGGFRPLMQPRSAASWLNGSLVFSTLDVILIQL